MAGPDWLRTFVAVYRGGSVTAGARRRGISQPAASQQLAALERARGAALFQRAPGGLVPTARGRELYGEVADALDQLERVLGGLDAGRLGPESTTLRVGAGSELFATVVLPRLAGLDARVLAVLGDDEAVVARVASGELDLAVTTSGATGRTLSSVAIGSSPYCLVCAPSLVPAEPFADAEALARWLSGAPWVSYSLELPRTRRLWMQLLGRPFAGDVRLAVPDRRAVVRAVELGLGTSFLPRYVCAEGLAAGRIVECHPVGDAVPAEIWTACWRTGDGDRPEVRAAIEQLAADPS